MKRTSLIGVSVILILLCVILGNDAVGNNNIVTAGLSVASLIGFLAVVKELARKH